MLLKNSSGTKSASYTMMIVAFVVVTLWLTVSIVAKIGHLEIRAFSGSEAMAYLTPILALYWGRRWSEDKAGVGTEEEKSDSQ
jgi:hypothetical protein